MFTLLFVTAYHLSQNWFPQFLRGKEMKTFLQHWHGCYEGELWENVKYFHSMQHNICWIRGRVTFWWIHTHERMKTQQDIDFNVKMFDSQWSKEGHLTISIQSTMFTINWLIRSLSIKCKHNLSAQSKHSNYQLNNHRTDKIWRQCAKQRGH